MKIQNGLVYTPDNKFFQQDLYIDGDYISNTAHDRTVLDAEGCYVIPGLTDLHFHGCNGYDFCDGTTDAIRSIAEYEASCGITSIAPSTMTLDDQSLHTIFSAAADYYKNPAKTGSDFIGIHMEGPYIAESKKGAQNPLYLHKPDVEHFRRMNRSSGGLIRLVTVAPELKGSMDFIEAVSEEVHVSLGHTSSDYDMAMTAFQAGANHVTHLYNAMNGYTHRSPGILGALVDTENATAELICDGIHIHPAAIRTTFQLLGKDRIILISDSMMATGLNDGTYALGGQPVTVTGNLATLHDGTIAGSATNLFDCMKKAVSFGIPLETAIQCAAYNPAKKLGMESKFGQLKAGCYANVLILDKNLSLLHVFLHGKQLY